MSMQKEDEIKPTSLVYLHNFTLLCQSNIDAFALKCGSDRFSFCVPQTKLKML